MKRVYIFALALVVFAYLPVSATIINIPDDYPSIQEGIDASTDGDTVLVQPRTYVENINFNGHNIVLGSLFLTTGDTSYVSSTVIDGNSSGSVVAFENGEDSTTTITGFTLQNGYAWDEYGAGIFCFFSNPIIANNIIRDNYAHGTISAGGGGIYCAASNPRIINNTIEDNQVGGQFTSGGGIYSNCFSSYIVGNRIISNSSGGEGGGIFCGNNATIVNNTIMENSADFGAGIVCRGSGNILIINNTVTQNSTYGGGGIACFASSPTIVNSIVYGNGPYEIYGTPSITYSNIGDTLWPGEGNISIDPLFRDPENGDFHLMSTACGDPYDSPCIDVGDPAIFDSILDCDWGLGEERSDMGAYGGQAIPTDTKEEHTPSLPVACGLLQNYPNPFNSSTTISFSVLESQSVTVTVYDLLGREIQTLLKGHRQAGVHRITYHAPGLASGIYFYHLQAGESVETRRMVILK